MQQTRSTFAGTQTAGADLVIDCVGSPQTMDLALACSRDGAFAEAPGGTVLLLGVAEQPLSIDPTQLITSQRNIVGVVGGNIPFARVADMAGVRGSHGLLSDELVTDHFDLNDVAEAVDRLRSGSVLGRALLHMNP